ncbi:hypothetical protein FHR70_004115 [Microvirga lupini]|uniref:Uncharacterized protein n=1 Tax=Microvirga lupini TaxID=420324 RepID=A0A7W4VPM2_9HYPH|nr:hypothetical protein [Microvirga lupini]MBB3021025.1 hypothetical protein [Microvirga lupini]
MALSKENAQALNAGFLDFLKAHFPQWLEHVRILRDEDAGQDFLGLTIPDPSGITHEHPLEISTWGEEITVFFGDFHTHFSWPEGFDGSDSYGQIIDFLQALLNEDIIIASVWKEDRMRLSSTAHPGDLTKFSDVPAGDHELRIASWRGTYDRRFPVDWQSYLKASHS